jgi:hypothetical protein
MTNGDFNTDWCDELSGGECFFVMYYKMYNQIWCSVARKPPSVISVFYNVPMSDKGGWLKTPVCLSRKDVFEHFMPHLIFTKRIKEKQIIYLHGSSKYYLDSRSSSSNHGKTI